MDSGSVGALGAILSALETLLSKYSCSQLPQESEFPQNTERPNLFRVFFCVLLCFILDPSCWEWLSARSKLLKKLESSLLGLAVAFPLFSYTVWRLTVYLQPQAE